MQSGVKEAKIRDPARDDGNADTIRLTPEIIKVADSDEKDDKKHDKRAVATYKVPNRWLKEDGDDTEQDVFEDAFSALLSPEADITTEQLRSLEILAHDRDFGAKLVESKPLSKLLSIAHSRSSEDDRKSAFRILGSSLWNNQAGLANVNEEKLISELLDALKSEKHGGVKASLIFSLSAVTAKEGGFKHFMERGGSPLLREAFATKDAEVQGKCATFVQDNYPANHEEAGVAEELTLWWDLFQLRILDAPSGPNVDKFLTTLMFCPSLASILIARALKTEARNLCPTKHAFLEWLATIVVEGSEDEHVYELVKQVRHLFGNPKAARKTAWEESPHHVRDEL